MRLEDNVDEDEEASRLFAWSQDLVLDDVELLG